MHARPVGQPAPNIEYTQPLHKQRSLLYLLHSLYPLLPPPQLDISQYPPTPNLPHKRLDRNLEVSPRKDDEETDGTGSGNLPKV